MLIETPRLRLRSFTESDSDAFAALNQDPGATADLGGVIDRATSDAKLDDFIDITQRHGYGRWVVESHAGRFLGYCGVMRSDGERHPLGVHDEIGWRLRQYAWGSGYATEAARAALRDVFSRVGLTEVLAYTAMDNLRSQAVMRRLNLKRDASRDFTIPYPRLGTWSGLVWVAENGGDLGDVVDS